MPLKYVFQRGVMQRGGKFANAKNKRAVRIANRYKIIADINGDGLEVYDLKSDPNEQNNLLSTI